MSLFVYSTSVRNNQINEIAKLYTGWRVKVSHRVFKYFFGHNSNEVLTDYCNSITSALGGKFAIN